METAKRLDTRVGLRLRDAARHLRDAEALLERARQALGEEDITGMEITVATERDRVERSARDVERWAQQFTI